MYRSIQHANCLAVSEVAKFGFRGELGHVQVPIAVPTQDVTV